MNKFFLTAMILGLTAVPRASAEDLKMPASFERLAARASDTVDVTLDNSMLQLAAKFLSNDDPDNVKVKQIISKLKGVFVRSFEFDKDAQYSMDDVEPLRAQLKSPQWSRIVFEKSKPEIAEVYVGHDGDKILGMVVIDAEPRELTIVHLDGPIDINDLTDLGGHMGIPKIYRNGKKGKDKEE